MLWTRAAGPLHHNRRYWQWEKSPFHVIILLTHRARQYKLPYTKICKACGENGEEMDQRVKAGATGLLWLHWLECFWGYTNLDELTDTVTSYIRFWEDMCVPTKTFCLVYGKAQATSSGQRGGPEGVGTGSTITMQHYNTHCTNYTYKLYLFILF